MSEFPEHAFRRGGVDFFWNNPLYGLSPCLQTLRIDKDGMIDDIVDVMHST